MSSRVVRILSLVLAFASMLMFAASPVMALQPVFVPSESYAGSEYYQRLLDVELTGDPRTDIVNVALSQLGYEEGGMEGQYSGDSRFCNNFTEYGYNFGQPDRIWCTLFVWWCARQAGVDSSVFPDTVWPRLLAVNCPYIGYTANAEIRPGDILFVENSGDDTTDHLALVTEVNDMYIIAVEGNCGNVVARIAYERGSGSRPDGLGDILYIGYPNYEKDPAVPDASSLVQYAYLIADTSLFNKHTNGVNQGKAQAGHTLQLLAVRADRQWIQVELGEYAYWIPAANAKTGTASEINEYIAQMAATTTTTTTTTIATTTSSEPEQTTTTSLKDGINPLTTTTTEATYYTVYTTSHAEALAPAGDPLGTPWQNFVRYMGRQETMILLGLFVLVIVVFVLLLRELKKTHR